LTTGQQKATLNPWLAPGTTFQIWLLTVLKLR
jgi:hypothetical protein